MQRSLEKELGVETIDVMRALKRTLDPQYVCCSWPLMIRLDIPGGLANLYMLPLSYEQLATQPWQGL